MGEQRYTILQPQFEMNPAHPIIKKLNELRTVNPQLAILVTEQLFANSMVSAGLVDDPRTMLKSMNELLEKALEALICTNTVVIILSCLMQMHSDILSVF